jgi:hypothetical protein
MRDNHITGTKLTKACDALSPLCAKTMMNNVRTFRIIQDLENCAPNPLKGAKHLKILGFKPFLGEDAGSFKTNRLI